MISILTREVFHIKKINRCRHRDMHKFDHEHMAWLIPLRDIFSFQWERRGKQLFIIIKQINGFLDILTQINFRFGNLLTFIPTFSIIIHRTAKLCHSSPLKLDSCSSNVVKLLERFSYYYCRLIYQFQLLMAGFVNITHMFKIIYHLLDYRSSIEVYSEHIPSLFSKRL